jgi:PAS domain S-box-containing protein
MIRILANRWRNSGLRLLLKRKRAAQILSASETRYRRLFETAQDGILILDAENGKIVDVNPFLIAMLGYSKEQFFEKYIWEIGAFKDVVANKENFLELQERAYIRYEDLPLESAAGASIQVEFVSNGYLHPSFPPGQHDRQPGRQDGARGRGEPRPEHDGALQ